MRDHGAFVPGSGIYVAPTARGKLDGLRFAVKDLIDIAGTITGGGNPDWASGQQSARAHASAVARMLAAGATLRGKTVTDELAFSLEGENAHYGTPINPRCPDRLPGGSSSGSAVAVAAGLVDFALGTDTGGSVRVPASFCGLYGYRPTHGRIPLDGVIPFAPSYDTVGLFTRTSAMLARVGRVLLASEASAIKPDRLLWAEDAFALAEPAVVAALPRLGEAVAIFDGAEAAMLEAYRVLQGAEIKACLGEWIAAAQPHFGSAIAPRFADALAITPEQAAQYQPIREAFATRLRAMLVPGTILLMPTAPCPALKLTSDSAARGDFYRAALTLTCIAGHAGLPAISMPVAELDGCPLGLSAIAGPGQDEALFGFALNWKKA